MSYEPLSPYQLVEAVLDRGLPFIATYIEKLLHHPIIIADHMGYIHYPVPKGTVLVDDLYISVPKDITESQSFYQINGVIYYVVGKGYARAYVLVKNISETEVSKVVSIISEYSLPIKFYFSGLAKVKQNTDLFINEYVKDIIFDSQMNIGRIIQQSSQALDFDKPYCISIAKIGKSADIQDLRLIKSYTLEYLKRDNFHIIPIEYPDSMTAIVPAQFEEHTLEINPDWPKKASAIKWKEDMEKRFNCIISFSIGRPYTLKDLHKSYNEARIVLALAELSGKKSFVQRFTDLGVFAFIFSQDKETIKKYCLHTLGLLIEYDEKNGAELLPTLRSLVDNDFNRKATADCLFVHINTLHYRVNKIKQVLNIDLAETSTRLNLFTAMRVWDTLGILGFLN